MTPSKDNQSVGSTMSTGAPAASDLNSLTIGPDGPILLHDVHFLEQMAHFNREKVPERQPHRHQLPSTASKPPESAGQHLYVRWTNGLRAQRERAGLRAQQREPRMGGRDRAGAGRLGSGWRDGAKRLYAMMNILDNGIHLAHTMSFGELDRCLDLVTYNGAKTLGVEGQYGIEEGKPANFLVLTADTPFEAVRQRADVLASIRHVEYLFKRPEPSYEVELDLFRKTK